MSDGINRLGIFATADEIAHIKHCQSMPLMAFSNPNYSTDGHPDKGKPVIPLCEAPIEAAHRAALAHGLPEIPGYYGIDLSNGEFVTALQRDSKP
jgi:hypothetical protein